MRCQPAQPGYARKLAPLLRNVPPARCARRGNAALTSFSVLVLRRALARLRNQAASPTFVWLSAGSACYHPAKVGERRIGQEKRKGSP